MQKDTIIKINIYFLLNVKISSFSLISLIILHSLTHVRGMSTIRSIWEKFKFKSY